MSRVAKISIICGVVLFVIILSIVGSYNSMISMDQRVKAAESDIETNLQRRSDLIPNLVETVKGYAAQEKDIFVQIADARSRLAGAQNIRDRANADNQLTGALSRLLAVVENYPELKSNQNFRDLSVALEGTENRIAIARQDYNNAAQDYNTTIRKFPNSIISSIFRFEEKSYYRASAGAAEVPKVDFNIK